MGELSSKIIAAIVVALLVFSMQSKKVHELIIALFGGTAPPVIATLLEDGKEDGQFWASIDKCGSKECYQLYLDKYPQGQFIDIAKLQLGINPTITTPVAPTPVKDKPVITPAPPITSPKNKDNGKRIKHYIAYKNGTAFDTNSNLLWMRCAFGQTWTQNHCSGEATKFDWEDATAQSTHFAGYFDWRLPTRKELATLVYCSNGSPDYFSMGKGFNNDDNGCEGKPSKDHKSPTILQRVFPNTDKTWFWSSSLGTGFNFGMWGRVDFSYGYVYGSPKNDDKGYVRLVRSGQ